MDKTKKAAIYIRVSTDIQIEGFSIDVQKEQLSSYCIAKGIKNYDFYIDGGWSGSNIERPEIQRLIKESKEGMISHVLVLKLDRLSRSQKDTLYLIEDVFIPNGISFISLTETLDTSTPMGKLMIGILSAFAQLERENIRFRTRLGMKERVKNGFWMGGCTTPTGYDYDKENGILVPNDESEKIKEVFRLYIEGYSCNKIALMMGYCNDLIVRNILTRKAYYGVIEYNGVVYQGRHEAIISKQTFDIAQEEINRRKKNRIVTSHYLLSGLVYCGNCGARMRYQKCKADVYIRCYSRDKSKYKSYMVKSHNCETKYFRSKDIEKAVLDKIFLLRELKKDNDIEDVDTIKTLEKQKTSLEQKIKKLYNIYAESDDDILLETIKDNKDKLSKLNKQLVEEKEHRSNKQSIDLYNSTVNNLKERWEYLDSRQRQQIVRLLVDRIVITNDKIVIKMNF